MFPPRGMSADAFPSGLVTFMFTDIVDSTVMKAKMNGATSSERQDAFLRQIKVPHEEIIRDRVSTHRGHIVKSTGDGFFVAFSDVEEAVLCAVEIQERLTAAGIPVPDGVLQIRIGIHSGPAAPNNGDYTASAVDKTARVENEAAPGTIYLSSETNSLIVGKVRGVATLPAGEYEMKGVGREALFIAARDGVEGTSALSVFPSTPRTSIANNLPSEQPFFGREEELEKIAEALEPENRTWGALIDGPGGMGKTSLAVRAAYTASPEHFRRIVFISLKTRELDDTGVRDLSGFLISGLLELLNEISRELGCADIAKTPENQRARLLLNALRGTRTLLVLDNLESLTKLERDELFTFIEKLPDGCKAILTARGRIGSGAKELILKKLSPEAALSILAELSNNNVLLARTSEAERLELYRVTDGTPLLLRWIAGQLGRGHCRTIADALDFLRSCPEENDPLEFVFGDLVGGFSVEEAQALSALAYFTLPVKVADIALLTEFSEKAIDQALRTLANRSLIIPSQEEQVFVLIPMVGDFLRRKRPDIFSNTGEKLSHHAYAIVAENGSGQKAPFKVLEQAWPLIEPALAVMRDVPNRRLQTFNTMVGRFLEFSGRWDEWLALSLDSETKALVHDDFISAGYRAFHGGWVHYLRRQPSEVFVFANRAVQHWTAGNARPAEFALAVRLQGHGFRLNGDLPTAFKLYSEAVEVWRVTSPRTRELSSGLNSLGESEHLLGQLEIAQRHFEDALDIAIAIDEREGYAVCTGNKAAICLDRHEWGYAENLALDALAASNEIGRRELIAVNSRRLAHALVRQGRKSLALPHARQAVDIYALLGSPDLLAAEQTLAECVA